MATIKDGVQRFMLKIGGSLSYLIAIFLNAFTDLGHKIIIQNTIFKIYDGSEQIVYTAIVNALILLPFILLFTPSAFIADRFSKHLILRYGALFAVFITLGITFSYYMGYFYVAFSLTFLLALQSALYSPAKYGYIKELFTSKYISSANAAVQGVTTVAILSGIIFYTTLFEKNMPATFTNEADILQSVAPLGWLLVGGSILEFLATLRLTNKDKSSHSHRFDMRRYLQGIYLQKNIKTMTRKKDIFFAIIALSIFWSISQVLLSVFGAYAKESLHITNTIVVQGVMALAAIGIVLGSLSAAKISKHYIHTGLAVFGAFGFTTMILLLPFTHTISNIAIEFLSFGFFAGLFLVPLNAYIQEFSPRAHLGTILAANNFVQNIFMLLFLLLTTFVAYYGLNVFYIFIGMFLIGLFLSFALVKNYFVMMLWAFLETLLKMRYKFIFEGSENLPKKEAVLYLGNHVSWVDWAIVQMPQQRRVHFVMDKEYYNWPIAHHIFKAGGAIPISNRAAKEALTQASEYLQKNEAVVLFPEGSISHSGQIGKFYKGFEKVCEPLESGVIIPFYMGGMYGSRLLSRAKEFQINRAWFRREVRVYFAKPMSIHSTSDEVLAVVKELENKYNSTKKGSQSATQ